MDQREIVSILKNRGVNQLFHADTVLTSLSFLQVNGICSRENLDRRLLSKTYQYSDKKDKEFDVYNDLFFDSVDIHVRVRGLNFYGPVTFVFDVGMLLNPKLQNRILITKSNPAKWDTEMPTEQRYFWTVEDLSQGFKRGDFGQSITLRHVPFMDFAALQYIILDRLPNEYSDLFENARREIEKRLREFERPVPLYIRNCDDDCKCLDLYKKMPDEKLMKCFKTKEGY